MSLPSLILLILAVVLSAAMLPIMLWQTIMAVRGLFPMKRRPLLEQRQYRFAVLVCARNEENVIGQLLDSLMAQDYPRTCYEVFVVADNCTDKTAAVSRAHGAKVYERFNTELVGKGHALKWVLERLDKEHPDEYDAICIFDADNLAAPNFLTVTNDAFCRGAEITQGYRDTKNPYATWTSGGYAIYWMILTRFYHAARYNWNFSAMVGGTGFAFKLSVLEGRGWNTCTLVEDCEFSIRQSCAGRQVVPLYDAVFYDEQPERFVPSVRQRHRWMVGTVQCCRYCLPLVWHSACHGNPRALDMAGFMLLIPAMGLSAPGGVCGFFSMLLEMGPLATTLCALGWLVGMWALICAVGFLTVQLEKRSVKKFAKAILFFPLFVLPMNVVALVALLRPRAVWKPIVHTDVRGLHEVSETAAEGASEKTAPRTENSMQA